jgi:uncharacterized repeat protein (TIGR01451 family)
MINQGNSKKSSIMFRCTSRQALLAITVVLGATVWFPASIAHAAGTPAGTMISNKATVRYTIGSNTFTQDSNTNTIAVDEIVNNAVTWQDAPPGVTVSPGQANRILTMRLTNIGNATDAYTLLANTAIAGDNFDPTLVNIYLDTNGNNIYDPGIDQLYIPAANDPALGPDRSLTIFVLCNIPSSGISDGNIGRALLNAVSKTGIGAPGTTFPGVGPGGTNAVIGASGGRSSATGAYVVSGASVNISKTAVVLDQYGGSQPITGATIRYTLAITAAGSGSAIGVVISDPIPPTTTYTLGTLKLNNISLSDALDADAGDVGGTTAGTVTVRLGDLTSASPVQTITFDVKIN